MNTGDTVNDALKPARLFYIDNLRGLLIMLVLLFHVAMSFGPVDGWYFYESHSSQLTTFLIYWFVGVNQAFFMGLLFMLSGYVTPASYKNNGAIPFLYKKMKKLLIPFLVYVVIITPILNYFYNFHYKDLDSTFFEYYTASVLRLRFNGSGPMWFLFILFAFSAGYALIKVCSSWREKRKYSVNSSLPSAPVIMIIIFVLAVITFAVRLVFSIDKWYCLLGITYIDFSHMPQYLFMFVTGIMMWKKDWLSAISDKIGKLWFSIMMVSVLLWPVVMISGGILQDNIGVFLGGFHWQAFVYSLWEMIVCAGACIGLPWLFRKKLNSESRIIRKLANASFLVYLIHAPVLVGIGYLFSFIRIYPLLKFIIEGIISISFCFAAAVSLQMLFRFMARKRIFYNIILLLKLQPQKTS